MLRILLAFIVSFLICVVIMPLIIYLMKKLKARQTILSYVDNHSGKSGTPTMGGIGVIIALSAGCLFFMQKENTLMLVTLLVTVGYGIIGFLDDFIKVFFKQNKGLSPIQKIIFQLLIAIIVALFAFFNKDVSDIVLIPFTLNEISLSYFAIPLYIAIFIAFTNAVNLTDGLDGLASKVTIFYTIFFAIMIALVVYFSGGGQAISAQYSNLIIFCACLVGSLAGFICFNGFPAKIFMGDTGALALGGAIAALAIFSRLSLMSPIIGIMYVLTSLSVVIQVIYFKISHGKRIFLMAPLHHHFERKGVHENRIVSVYSLVTILVGCVSVAIILFLN